MKNSRFLIVFLFLAFFLAGCQANDAVEAVPAATTTLQRTIAEGRLMPEQYLDLAFPSAGRVAEVLVSEGDVVMAGQVLARLELLNPEARQAELARAEQELLAAQQALDTLQDPALAAVRIAQARLDLTNLDQQPVNLREQLTEENDLLEPDELLVARLEAQIELLNAQLASTQALLDKVGSDGIDPAGLEAAETRLQTAKAAQAAALAALQPVELTVPWDGTLTRLNLLVGQPVSAGVAVATLADLSTWVVKTDNLTEIEVVGLQVGQEVVMILDALPETELNGKISVIRSQYEEKRGDITYTVTISLDAVDPEAKWGMTAAVILDR